AEVLMYYSSRDPGGDAEAELILRCLPAGIAALSPRQRTVMIYRYYENRSIEEIAASLGIGPRSARISLQRALVALRRALRRAGVSVPDPRPERLAAWEDPELAEPHSAPGDPVLS